jgi:hypothetical protein
MPLVRCIDCRRLDRRSPCSVCRQRRKAIRNQHARALGPCPQDGVCARCGEPAKLTDPLTWGHVESILIGGSWQAARPEHRSCNSKDRGR